MKKISEPPGFLQLLAHAVPEASSSSLEGVKDGSYEELRVNSYPTLGEEKDPRL